MKRLKVYLFVIAILLGICVKADSQTGDSEKRTKIKTEILKAKSILEADNGKLWGEKIWSDNLLVIDYDNTIYSLAEFPGSVSDDSGLFYKKIPANTLSFVNTTQKYEGQQYATVLTNYLNDQSSTIIHELFHLLQFKKRTFNGNPVDYLDESEARKLLRSEYASLKNTLKAINEKKDRKQVALYFKDALVFRKIRQEKYRQFLPNELEIETLEGMANYTGFVLSTYENKYQKAIEEINRRESAQTYTRPFPYATGPAYGLIFDHLKISWKKGLGEIYNFLDIYEKQILKSNLKITDSLVENAQKRSDYAEINRQEDERTARQKALIEYYTKMFVASPTLKVQLADMMNYSRSFNMNGTLVLDGKGTIYSSIKGTDRSGGKNFGNFSTIEGKNQLGIAGILGYEKPDQIFFEFPLPLKIQGSKITGEFYEIVLNEGWEIVKESDGGMTIIKKN